MYNIKKTKKYYNKKGFALLFAVITASVLLTIGLSIFNISLKELLLSTASRDTQVAFYAADSARECALYWDTKFSAFKTCLDYSCTSPSEGRSAITCASTTLDNISLSSTRDGNIFTTIGSFTFSERQSSLNTLPDASFTIIKTYLDGDITTSISTLGHNAEIGERRVERGILQTY